MSDYGGPERRTQVEIGMKLDMLHEDVTDMKAVLKDLTTAINRLALVEERQTQTAAALERAFGVIAKIEERIAKLETQAATAEQSGDWASKAFWAVVGAALVFIAKKFGAS